MIEPVTGLVNRLNEARNSMATAFPYAVCMEITREEARWLKQRGYWSVRPGTLEVLKPPCKACNGFGYVGVEYPPSCKACDHGRGWKAMIDHLAQGCSCYIPREHNAAVCGSCNQALILHDLRSLLTHVHFISDRTPGAKEELPQAIKAVTLLFDALQLPGEKRDPLLQQVWDAYYEVTSPDIASFILSLARSMGGRPKPPRRPITELDLMEFLGDSYTGPPQPPKLPPRLPLGTHIVAVKPKKGLAPPIPKPVREPVNFRARVQMVNGKIVNA